MTYGLVLFLYSWNSPFYRFGGLSYDTIESCIRDNLEVINKFKTRSILTFCEADEQEVSKLFLAFLKATKRPDGAESPVSASKSLHPVFFFTHHVNPNFCLKISLKLLFLPSL